MANKKPMKKAPAKKAGAKNQAEKRLLAAARRESKARFDAQHGEGHNVLENFIYEYETLGNWEDADPNDMQRLFEYIEEIAGAVNRYLGHECRRLDIAFRVRRPDGYRQKAARKRYLYRRQAQVVGRILKSAGAVVDAAFFEVIGEVVGVSKTQASEWYYEVKFPPYKQVTDLPPALEKYRQQLRWKK